MKRRKRVKGRQKKNQHGDLEDAFVMKKRKKARDGSTRRVSCNSLFHCFSVSKKKALKLKVQVIHISKSLIHTGSCNKNHLRWSAIFLAQNVEEKVHCQDRTQRFSLFFSTQFIKLIFEAAVKRSLDNLTVVYQSHNGTKTRPRLGLDNGKNNIQRGENENASFFVVKHPWQRMHNRTSATFLNAFKEILMLTEDCTIPYLIKK